MEMIVEETTSAFDAAGRAVASVVTVPVEDRAGLGSTLKLVTGGKIRPDRFEVVTAEGPLGREVVIWPMMASTPLPGEYHVRLRGALRSAAVYANGFISVNWSSTDQELQAWLRQETFHADELPNQMKQGLTKLELKHVVDVFAEAPDVSRIVVTLGGFGGIGTVKTAIKVAGRLAPSIALSSAPGPNEPLGGVRYQGLADAAFAGVLEEMAQPHLAESTADRPPMDPSDRLGAIRAAATPHVGKRVLLGPIEDTKRAANVFDKVARGADPSSLVAFVDTGMRANGKAGIAFTTNEIHVNELGDHSVVRYHDLRSVRSANGKVTIVAVGVDDMELLVGNDEAPIVDLVNAAMGNTNV